MMKVYVLVEYREHKPTKILGVYSSVEAARTAAAKDHLYLGGVELDWVDFGKHLYSNLYDGNRQYIIRTHELGA